MTMGLMRIHELHSLRRRILQSLRHCKHDVEPILLFFFFFFIEVPHAVLRDTLRQTGGGFLTGCVRSSKQPPILIWVNSVLD